MHELDSLPLSADDGPAIVRVRQKLRACAKQTNLHTNQPLPCIRNLSFHTRNKKIYLILCRDVCWASALWGQ